MHEAICATHQAGKWNDEGHNRKQDHKSKDRAELPKTEAELQLVLQSESDRRVTQALKTAGIKWQQKLIKRLAAERSEAERLAKMTLEKREKEVLEIYGRELEEKEKILKARELELKVIRVLLDKKLPVEFKDFVLSQDEDTSIQKAEELGRLWDKKLQEALDTHTAAGDSCRKGL